MRNFNVLVFPAGKENSLEIYTALKDSLNITLFGASSRPDHGLYVFNNYVSDLPLITEPHFLDTFNALIEKNNIDIVFSTHDTISLFFAENANKIKTKIAGPGYEACLISRYKDKTYNLFAGASFCPQLYAAGDTLEYPVFAKPIIGEASQNTKLIKNDDELKFISGREADYVLCEYLPGNELTVDCFTDRHNNLRFIGPRQRNRTHTGISLNSRRMPLTDEIKGIAEAISSKMTMRGLWFFQVKQDKEGRYKLLEISVRTAGTMALYRVLGINLPLLTVYDAMDIDFNIMVNNMDIEIDRSLFNKFKIGYEFDNIYIDFDDTITKNGKPNEFVMLFLYKMRNAGKRISLLTRHEYDLDETLTRLAISKLLFDNIIHTTWKFKKSHFITETERTIFIDNSFAEREEVSAKHNIPVFDVDAIECLIDWRDG